MSEFPELTVQEEDIQVIVLGAPKTIEEIANMLNSLEFVKFAEWSEVQQNENSEQVKMSATKTLYGI